MTSNRLLLLADFLEWKRYLSIFLYIEGSFHFRKNKKNNEAGRKPGSVLESYFLGLIYLDGIVSDTTPAVHPWVWDEPSTHCLTLLLIRFAVPSLLPERR